MILIHNGARFTPPLITKRKNKKWYVYSTSSETYQSNSELRTYLIDKSNQYSLNLRGFLKYLTGESYDNNRIDKTMETLSECDKYVSIKIKKAWTIIPNLDRTYLELGIIKSKKIFHFYPFIMILKTLTRKICSQVTEKYCLRISKSSRRY